MSGNYTCHATGCTMRLRADCGEGEDAAWLEVVVGDLVLDFCPGHAMMVLAIAGRTPAANAARKRLPAKSAAERRAVARINAALKALREETAP